ncbi:MAG TPA: 1-phosphofructokinase family hexose kinase [Anaerolineaceae bacterium]|nr:1-phosphofructokinase family hexose kinase [Anaerolineaceae bacterium]
MFLTITANSALDRVIYIDEFIPGTTMRPQKLVESVGGKGFDTSVVYRALGQETLALGFVAGETGKALVRLLDKYGIQHDLIWVNGETRIADVIVEIRHNRHSHLIAQSYQVNPDAYRDLLGRFEAVVAKASWVVASGSLPEGIPANFYGTLAEIARKYNVPILIDCPGEPARQAIPFKPAILKMNNREFSETFGIDILSLDDLKQKALSICQMHGIQTLVITCGEQGILAITAEGCYLAASPKQKEVNAAGAGDAASATLTWRFSLGESWRQAVQWAAATSAATVLTEGTADCNFSDIERIYPLVTVQTV